MISGALLQMGVVLSRASHASWSLAANTNALDVAIQLSRGLCHMSAISAAGGKHAVVDGTRRLSTGLAAFFSVVTPGGEDEQALGSDCRQCSRSRRFGGFQIP